MNFYDSLEMKIIFYLIIYVYYLNKSYILLNKLKIILLKI